jgi:hypothetical protein
VSHNIPSFQTSSKLTRKKKTMDRSKIGQFFKDTFKKDDSNTPVKSGEIINFIFARYSFKEREELMNFIDDFIINEFNIRQSELPWLNSTQKDREEDWTNFFVYLRLAIARILDQGRTHNRKQKILN